MKFQRTGSVHDDSRNGHTRKSGKRIKLFRETFQEDPQLSICRASNMSEIPCASTHRILRCDLKKKNPCHIHVYHNLQEEDYPHNAAMCAELIVQLESANLIK